MQITRHWRLNSQRYRLEGIRYVNGEVNLQARPVPKYNKDKISKTQPQQERVTVTSGGPER